MEVKDVCSLLFDGGREAWVGEPGQASPADGGRGFLQQKGKSIEITAKRVGEVVVNCVGEGVITGFFSNEHAGVDGLGAEGAMKPTCCDTSSAKSILGGEVANFHDQRW